MDIFVARIEKLVSTFSFIVTKREYAPEIALTPFLKSHT